MKFGMNLLLWTGEASEDDLPVIEQLKEIGYDGVELPMFTPDASRFKRLGERLDDLGLARTAVTVCTAEANPISPDPAVRKLGVEAVKAVLDSCTAAGVEILVGPYHSALGEFSGRSPTEDEWMWGVESVQEMAEYAGQVDVRLAIEPLNRFEIYLLNAQADAARFVREVNHPHCGILYDTFHVNIEEKSIPDAVATCSDVIELVHISENDRSTPGLGAVDWRRTFDSLHQAGYDGWMVCEAFGRSLPDLAAATKIWRKMFDSEMQLARDALAFMKQEVARRWK